jgi:ABC-type microcin C transport system permease subunit YejE
MKLMLLIIVRRISFYVYILLFIAGLIFGLIAQDKVIIFLAIGYLVFLMLVYTISILYMGLSKKNRDFFIRKQLAFNDQNILTKTPISEEAIEWKAFIRWRKIGGYY